MIGKTPVIFLENLGIFLKLEEKNPTGSVKDRPVYFMVKRALMDGRLKEGGVLVEPTSGNTAIAMAMMGALFNLRVIAVMPESMSERKMKMVEEYGGEVVKTPADEGMAGAVRRARELVEETGGMMLDQFNNPDNPLSHELTTGPEILSQMDFRIDAFVCGVGTGGTVTGVSRVLRKFFGEGVKIFAVEPAESPVLSGGKPSRHGIEGIGAGFVPGVLELNLVDEIMRISTDEALDMKKYLARKEGISVGPSTGANVAAALKVKDRFGFDRVVTMEMDGGLRYV